MDTNFGQEWLDIVPRCQESIDLIQVVTPHLSSKISDFAHCVLLAWLNPFLGAEFSIHQIMESAYIVKQIIAFCLERIPDA